MHFFMNIPAAIWFPRGLSQLFFLIILKKNMFHHIVKQYIVLN